MFILVADIYEYTNNYYVRRIKLFDKLSEAKLILLDELYNKEVKIIIDLSPLEEYNGYYYAKIDDEKNNCLVSFRIIKVSLNEYITV